MRWVSITQLSTLIVILIGTIIYSTLTKRRIAEQVATDLHNSLIIGEYRNALVVSSLAAKTNFSSIFYDKKDGERAFSVPIGTVDDLKSFGKRLIVLDIRYTADDLASEAAGKLYFAFNILDMVPQAVVLWLLITIVCIPLYWLAFRRVERRHLLDVESQRNLAIAQVSQNLAHDLKNPLIAFDFAARAKTWGEFVQLRDHLNRSIAAVQGIISAIGTGDNVPASPRDSVVDLGLIAADILRSFQNSAVKIQYTGVKTVHAFLDAVALERALLNLVRNAVESGATEVLIEASVADPELTLTVSDNGPGLPMELADRLFQRGSTHGKTGGSGIGLFNVQSIVKAHGGDVQYRRADRKTIFEMTFPNAVMTGVDPMIAHGGDIRGDAVAEGILPTLNAVFISLRSAERQAAISEILRSNGITVITRLSANEIPLIAYVDVDENSERSFGSQSRVIFDEPAQSIEKSAKLLSQVYNSLQQLTTR